MENKEYLVLTVWVQLTDFRFYGMQTQISERMECV